MRLAFLIAAALVCSLAHGAAPPPRVPPAVAKLIDKLDDDDEDVRKGAMKKLEALGEDVIPALERAAKTHADTDVRLRARVVIAAIDKKLYGEVRQFKGSGDGVISIAVSPDGKELISTCAFDGSDRLARIWDVKTGKELRTLVGHTWGVRRGVWFRNGKAILTGSTDGTVRVWDSKTGKEQLLLRPGTSVMWAALTPDAKKAISCGSPWTIDVWDLEKKKLHRRLSGHTQFVHQVVTLADSKHFVSASYDKTLKLWNVDKDAALRTFTGHTGSVWALDVAKDQKRLVSAGEKGNLRLWDLKTAKLLKTLKGHTSSIHGVAFSPDGRRILSCGYDKTARLWDVETGKTVQILDGHTGHVMCCLFLDNRTAVTCSHDKTIRVWKLRK